MNLLELLAANTGAKAEYDAALATARAEGKTEGKEEATKHIEAMMGKVGPILASDAYDKTTKEMGVLVVKGEKSIEAFEAVVAIVDRENEKAKEAAALKEQSEDTQGAGDLSAEEQAEAGFQARKDRLKEGV